MTSTATQTKINDWVTGQYGVTPATSGTNTQAGGGAATSAATSGTGMLAAAASTAKPNADVASWYRSTLGRDGDAAGIAYWQKALDGGGNAESLYGDFQKAATANKEVVKAASTWEAANQYTGPSSSDKTTMVDDWARNVLGRNLNGTESVQWSAAMNAAKTPEEAQKVYQNFLTTMGSQVKNPMDFANASQINAGLPGQAYSPTTIDKSQITHRTIDPTTETVQGQLKTVLAADSPVLQQARAEAMRAAADRGMLNSAMAASGGEDAVIRAATGIATTDSGYYNKASDYNAAADNQALMFNAQAENSWKSATQSLDAQAAQQDKSIAAQAEIQRQQASYQDKQLAQQMTIAQIQDATTRLGQTAGNDNQKLGLANNIIQNMELSPDRKAALLQELGFGTTTREKEDGSIVPGTGLAGAVYVISSTSADLRPTTEAESRAQAAANGMIDALG